MKKRSEKQEDRVIDWLEVHRKEYPAPQAMSCQSVAEMRLNCASNRPDPGCFDQQTAC